MENLTELLTALAEKLGTTTEYLWGVLVSQAQVDAYIKLLFVGFTVLFIIAYSIFCKYTIKHWDEIYSDDKEVVYVSLIILIGIAVLIFLGCAIDFTGKAIVGLLNPEYWALQQVLQLL